MLQEEQHPGEQLPLLDPPLPPLLLPPLVDPPDDPPDAVCVLHEMAALRNRRVNESKREREKNIESG